MGEYQSFYISSSSFPLMSDEGHMYRDYVRICARAPPALCKTATGPEYHDAGTPHPSHLSPSKEQHTHTHRGRRKKKRIAVPQDFLSSRLQVTLSFLVLGYSTCGCSYMISEFQSKTPTRTVQHTNRWFQELVYLSLYQNNAEGRKKKLVMT